jgi:hypothetical protein
MSEFSRIPAPRKHLKLPVRYRVEHYAQWCCGTTENLSRSGVLMRLETPLWVSARIYFVLKLPARVLESAPTDLICVGTVRRFARTPNGDPEVGVEFDDLTLDALDAVIARM